MAYTPTDNPYIPGDPYSYDLKWIVAKIKEALSSIEGLTTGQSDLSNDFEALKQYVDDYFDNLDISQEVEDKINELYAAGFFDDIIEEWMNGHIKWTNPNLADNGWFTVNQRGFTSGTVAGASTDPPYPSDRWKLVSGDADITVNANGLRILFNQAGQFRQKLSTDPIPDGDITISVLEQNGTITILRNTTGTNQVAIPNTNGVFLVFNRSNRYVEIYGSQANSIVAIRAIKVEKGPYSTIGNDTAPNYPVELAKCQYYAKKFNTYDSFEGMAITSTYANIYIPWTHKSDPTISYTGTIQIYTSTGESKVGTSIGLDYNSRNQVRLTISGLTNLTPNTPIRLILQGPLILSCD